MPNYLSVSEYAEKHEVNEQYVRFLCRQKKIKGAKKPDRDWRIPENAEYTAQRRK